MMEEAIYNPFVEGEATLAPPQNLASSFIESNIPYDSKKLSYIDVFSTRSPALSRSAHSPVLSHSGSHSPLSNSSYQSSVLSQSPNSLSASSYTLRAIPDPQQLENPFMSDTPSLKVTESDGGDVLLPSLLIKTSHKLTAPPSPLVKNGHARSPSTSSHLAISTTLSAPPSPSITSPRADPDPAPLYTHSPLASSSQAYITTVDKVDWVPDEYSQECEHCASLFTFIRRRHHCRGCGHLYCGDCIIKVTLPAQLGFLSSQKTCLHCAYQVIVTRGIFMASMKSRDGLSIGQKLSGKMQNFMYKMAGMVEGGKFDRFAAGFTSPIQFTSSHVAEVVNLKIPSFDNYMMTGHAYIPPGDGPFPVVVFIPGGNFVLGEQDSSAVIAMCKELCARVGCIVVSVGYRLAPEHHFPVPWEDCYSAVKWVYESSMFDLPKLEKDPKIVVCGEGSGGLLAAAVCHMAKDRKGTPPIRYQLLITPWLLLTNLNYDKFEDNYVLTKDLMKWVVQQVFQEANDCEKPFVSPFLALSFAGLPPTKIITAGHDPLHYEGEEYANKLRTEGVNASVTRYENSFHGFMGNYVDSYSESEEAMFECVVCLREVFGIGEFQSAKAAQSHESSERFYNL